METLLCHKCGHGNSAAQELCSECGHHLYVFCPCGTRNVRSNDVCLECGEALRRKARPDNQSLEIATARPSFPIARESSHPSDLKAALAMFGLVGVLFGSIFLYPVVRDIIERRQEDQDRQFRGIVDEHQRGDIQQIQQRNRLLDQEKREHAPWDKWINGK